MLFQGTHVSIEYQFLRFLTQSHCLLNVVWKLTKLKLDLVKYVLKLWSAEYVALRLSLSMQSAKCCHFETRALRRHIKVATCLSRNSISFFFGNFIDECQSLPGLEIDTFVIF